MLVAARAARAARAACAWIGWVAGSCLTPELSRRRPLVGHPQKNRFLSDESRSHSHGFGRQHCKVTHIPLRPREVARTCARNGSSGKSVSGSFAHEETDTARTRRTRHGSLRCREKRLVREKQNDCRLTTTAAADATSRQSEACPAAERSVLCQMCPCCVRFFMGVDAGISGAQTQVVVRHAPQFTNRALGTWKEELQDGSHQPRPRRLVVRRAFDLHVVQIDA